MPQFTFSATDRMGNTVEGTVNATDEMFASDEVRRMGYRPQRLSPVGAEPSVATAEAAVSAPPVGAPLVSAAPPPPARTGPPLIDLTQPVTEMPALANTLIAPTTSGNMERLEPWQRGGPVEQMPEPQGLNTMNTTGAMPAVASQTVQSPAGIGVNPVIGREGARIPYAPGVPREVSFFQRLKETLVYPIFSGVVIKDLAPFYRQFATLINAGLPLYQALVGLEANTGNAKLKEIARAGQKQVMEGGKFSDVMAAYPWIFPPMQYELVRAAEMGGMLDQVLINIADYIDHDLEIRRLVSRETMYPKFVLFFALMILGKNGFSGGFPAIAGLVLTGNFRQYLSDTVGFGLSIVVPFLVIAAIFRLFLFNVKGVRESYDTFKMAIPGLGNIVRQFGLAKFGRTFAALYRGGFSMSTSLEIAGNASGNAVIRNAAHSAVRKAEQGMQVSEALEASGIFPPMALNMFRTGESSGSLDQLLEKMADYFESEAKTKSHMLAIGFGVGVFLIVSLIVARAVIGFYMGGGTEDIRKELSSQ